MVTIATATARKIEYEYECVLTDMELRLVVQNMYKMYAMCVFKILRAMELNNYRPAEKERETAYAELCVVLACGDIADQVLEYHIEAERKCRIRNGAEDDERFLEAAEALRGYIVAPLIAAVETKTAFVLWRCAGSWAGAMELAGLDPLEGAELTNAIRQYAINRAAPELLPIEMRKKLSPECVMAMRRVCNDTREAGRIPNYENLKHVRGLLNSCNLNAKSIFLLIGLELPKKPKKQKNTENGNNVVKDSVEAWKARNSWWRNSKKMKKHQAEATRCEQERIVQGV